MIEEQRASMFQNNLQLDNENTGINSFGVRIFERRYNRISLLTNLRTTGQRSVVVIRLTAE